MYSQVETYIDGLSLYRSPIIERERERENQCQSSALCVPIAVGEDSTEFFFFFANRQIFIQHNRKTYGAENLRLAQAASHTNMVAKPCPFSYTMSPKVRGPRDTF